MKKIIIGGIIVAALLYGVLGLHIIITDDGVKILKKVNLALSDTVVDARGIKKHKLFTHPALLKAGIREALN